VEVFEVRELLEKRIRFLAEEMINTKGRGPFCCTSEEGFPEF